MRPTALLRRVVQQDRGQNREARHERTDAEETDPPDPAYLSPTGGGPDGACRLAALLRAEGGTSRTVTSSEDAFRAADDVLNNAVAGIAEIINNPGLVNVDFQDVRTVMSEQGMAMMGAAAASGIDRARIAAEQAIACPLLEGVNLAGARGVLVNITASKASLKLRETKEVMNIVRTFAAEDATIIYGGVYDDALAESLRVTVVATGLGMPSAARQPKPQLVLSNATGQKTGTDNLPGPVDYHQLDAPAVIRRNRASTVEALQQSGVDKYDIPAFLRKQAD